MLFRSTRSGAETDTDLADDFEAQVEAHPLLAPLLVSADNAAGVNTTLVYDGITSGALRQVVHSDDGSVAVVSAADDEESAA